MINFGTMPQRCGNWTWFKAIAATKILSIQSSDDAALYTVYGYDGNEALSCVIWRGEVPVTVINGGYSQAQNDADLADFETNYLPTANRSLRNAQGASVVAPTFLFSSEQARLQGYALSCAPDSVAILDVEVTVQMLVQGGQFWIADGQIGDLGQFSVVDKNDVLGLHTANNIALGTPIELVRYVKDYRPPTVTLWKEDIIMPTVAPVAPGLFLRTIYEAVAGGGTRNMGVLFRWYIG